jgi:hypothetical protein
MGNAVKDVPCVASWFTGHQTPDIKLLSKADRHYVLKFLFDIGASNLVARFMLALSKQHRLDIRFFGDRIDHEFMRKFKPLPDFFQFVTVCLSKKIQRRFVGDFCEALERGDFQSVEFDPGCNDDPQILNRIRAVIRKILSKPSGVTYKENIGQLVSRYGESSDLERIIGCQPPDDFLYGFLKGFKHSEIQIPDSLKPQIISLLKAYITQHARRHYCDVPKLDLYCSFVIRLTKTEYDIRILTKKIDSSRFILTNIERAFLNLECQDIILQEDHWNESKHRLIEGWPCLDKKIRTSILATSLNANILAENPTDPNYVRIMLNSWRREDILPGYKTFLTLNDVCLEKFQLTAQLFFVEDFEEEIETAGYLGILDLALFVQETQNSIFPLEIRE